MAAKCPFTTSKLSFFGHFYLAAAVSKPFFSSLPGDDYCKVCKVAEELSKELEMANRDHLRKLGQGRAEWNNWRKQSAERPDLSAANLAAKNLAGYNLSQADMSGSKLWDAQLRRANLIEADLSACVARFATFSSANLTRANLQGADLRAGSLRRANLTEANLESAVLRFTSLVEANVTGANLHRAEIYGIGAWDLKGEPANQSEMIIQQNKNSIPTTIDDLDTAQLLFLLLDNPKIADVIDTASRRIVLLLGRFTPAHKPVLNAMKDRLLRKNFAPVLFDFDRPQGRDLTETVASLAHMACFVVADLSGAKSVPQELSFIVPYLPSVPVVPLVGKSEREYAMFQHFLRYPWVQKPIRYRDLEHLMSIFDQQVLSVGFKAAMHARGTPQEKLPGSLKLPKSARPA